MLASSCPSSLAALLFLLATACGPPSETCGPDDDAGLTLPLSVNGGEFSVTYGGFVASVNNDCPDPAAPTGVISLSIHAQQLGGGAPFTICIPRPDQLDGPIALGTAIQLIDVDATLGNCTFELDDTRMPTATASFRGLCDDGADQSGFSMLLDGSIPVLRTCDAGAPEPADLLVNAAVVVAAP